MKLRTLLFISFVAVFTTGCGMFGHDRDRHRDHHPAAAAPSTDAGMSMRQEGMQQHMQKMQDTMAKIHQTKSPAERQKLMDEHMTMMQEGMVMMKDMQGKRHSMMMDDGEKKTCADKKKDSMMGEGRMMCMGMMEQMMEQMQQHQAAQQK